MNEHYIDNRYPLSDITAQIIAAAQTVYHEIGSGFNEVIYQRSLAIELNATGLDFSREVWINVHYKNQKVGRKRVDFMVEGVMVEIKAKSEFADSDFIQTLSYLKASGGKVGLLLNFGAKQLQIKRFAN